MFEEYYKEIKLSFDKLYNNYMGINKKEFPKWQGWKIISSYKESGADIKSIQDPVLEMHVRNFYYLKYLKERFTRPEQEF